MNEMNHFDFENHSFVDPDSINIVGARENDGEIYEADVTFQDFHNDKWYMTIVSGDTFIGDALNVFENIGPDDLVEYENVVEPAKFVWNGKLNEHRIKDIINGSTIELLKPYLIKLEQE
jgi:hypothetical protein